MFAAPAIVCLPNAAPLPGRRLLTALLSLTASNALASASAVNRQRKRALRMAAALLSCFLLLISAPSHALRIEWPWGGETSVNTVDDVLRIAQNPMAVVVPTGLPTQQSLTQFILHNPDKIATILRDPSYLPYLPIADAMVQGRNAALITGTMPIPNHVKKALLPFFANDAGLLDSVRWTTNWSAVQNSAQTAQFFRDRDTQAITLINVVVFRLPEGVDDPALWAHELHHVKQYRDWGVLEFAKRWANSQVEQSAYAFEDSVRSALSLLSVRNPAQSTQLVCSTLNASMAYCDMYVAPSDSARTFVVQADASARGNGTRSGHMSLVLVNDGVPCNSDTSSHGVDNETRLQGVGFRCSVIVRPGEMRRVLAIAPNDRADAVATQAAATLLPLVPPSPPRKRMTTGTCREINASEAKCELTAGDIFRYSEFVVRGRARASGTGTRSGTMRLELKANGSICNSGAFVTRGVDNATELSGDAYLCRITVNGGETAVVTVSAPNSRATAVFTRAEFSFRDGPVR